MTPSAIQYWHEIDSPVGKLLLAGDGSRLTHICFQSGPHPMRPQEHWAASREPFETAIAQLSEYFEGRRHKFDLPLAPAGTDFRRRVWRALAAIPYGQTISYGELARRIGSARAARAVGLANGANPLPIIVPCHRVIGANGSLTGFGGGLPIKRALLALERALPEQEARSSSRQRKLRAI
jgi:methylated-DNA-[protein]-cysteine S-methyltransferase